MLRFTCLCAALAVFQLSASLPVEDKIEPVDLAHSCVRVKNGEQETKSPVLLLHGLGGSSRVWKRLVLLLATQTKREVCAVDLRNHGDTEWNNRTDIEALATDVGHFLDKRGVKKINILGQSLGGKTAIHFALKHPERVDSIITEDISPNTLTKESLLQISSMLEILNTALQTIPEGIAIEDARKSLINFINKKLEEMGSSDRIPEVYEEVIELKQVDGKWRFKYNFDIFREALKNIQSIWTVSSGLYEGPALFIYGTKSPFKVADDKENILKLFPKAEFLPVEGASHMIHGVFKEFDDAVIRFLNKVN